MILEDVAKATAEAATARASGVRETATAEATE